MRRIGVLMVPLLMMAVCAGAATSPPDLPKARTEVKTVAVFKNGLGFFYRTGQTELKEGWAVTDPIPPAVLGTFWVGVNDPRRTVTEIISFREWVTNVTPYAAASLAELLEANVGKVVTLTYNMDGVKQIRAEIVAVPERNKPGNPQGPGDIVILKPVGEPGGILALNKGQVVGVQMEDVPELSTKTSEHVARAKLHVSGNPSSADLTMAYLRRDITWVPGYLLDLLDDKNLQITLEAVLANDAEELKDAEVSFVVGYPSFMYSGSTSPLALGQDAAGIAATLGRLAPSSFGAAYQTLTTNMALASSARENYYDASTSYAGVQDMAAEGTEDLYLYTQPNVSLKPGERARYTIFSAKVPYSHIYRWDVQEQLGIDVFGNRLGTPAPQSQNAVWHALKVQNNTEHPWTTGAAFAVKGKNPVAQGGMEYTSRGSEATVRLTVAADLLPDQKEVEISRVRIKDDDRYDEVTVQGELTVRSFKDEDVKLEVQKPVVGEVTSASHDAKVEKVVKTLTAVNPQSVIKWETTLPANQTLKLTYEYRALVRR